MAISDRQKWNQRYRDQARQVCPAPNAWLQSLGAAVPSAGRALDLAGGAGGNALWLAQRGLEVTLVDIAEEGLAVAQRWAAEQQLLLTTLASDLSQPQAMPAGRWDLVICFCYLQRSLFSSVFEQLAPAGKLLALHPTSTNLERNARPPRRFLLEPGELAGLARKSGFEILQSSEGWSDLGRHEARLVAQKPGRG